MIPASIQREYQLHLCQHEDFRATAARRAATALMRDSGGGASPVSGFRAAFARIAGFQGFGRESRDRPRAKREELAC